jgi:zinc/manganese transport system ATP-binding protein
MAQPFLATPCLALRDLTLGYDRHPAVHHLDCTLQAGEMLAVVGPNGGGKSTLLKAIAGQIAPLGGQIENSFPSFAYMPQIGALSRDFPVTVLDLALTGLSSKSGMFGRLSHHDRARTEAAIDAVGLSGFEDRSIRKLSGGQMQRLLFARLMVQDAALILLDEPFAAIDARTIADLLVILHGWNQEGRTILAVLHDFELVRRNFSKSLLLAREPIAFGATEAVLSEDNLARARRMSEAFDGHAAICHRAA